jgi:LIVCS family branched-chain amino acid:cation transporter
LLYLGSTGTAIFSPNTPHTALLIGFIDKLFGSLGHQALAFAAVFACLTTAIGLTAGASNFFRRLTRGRLPYKFNVVVICAVSLLISTLGVDAIVRYAAPVLICIYPTSIVLVLLNVFRCPLINKGTFLGAAYSTLLVGFFEMLPALGFPIDRTFSVFEILPFATHGFAWTAPAVAFGVLGTLLYRMWGKESVGLDQSE